MAVKKKKSVKKKVTKQSRKKSVTAKKSPRKKSVSVKKTAVKRKPAKKKATKKKITKKKVVKKKVLKKTGKSTPKKKTQQKKSVSGKKKLPEKKRKSRKKVIVERTGFLEIFKDKLLGKKEKTAVRKKRELKETRGGRKPVKKKKKVSPGEKGLNDFWIVRKFLTRDGNKKIKWIRIQTAQEEMANSMVHAIGAGFGITALLLLVFMSSVRGDFWRIASFVIYGASLSVLYLASTLYHAFTNEKLKNFFRIIDHSSVYLLIAGTYTPVTLVFLRDTKWGWPIFFIIWACAISGIVMKFFITKKLEGKLEFVSTGLYVVMGWLIVIALKPLAAAAPLMIFWLMIGGILYTGGLVFYVWETIPYHHTIWHIFVLGGSVTHFIGMLVQLVKKL